MAGRGARRNDQSLRSVIDIPQHKIHSRESQMALRTKDERTVLIELVRDISTDLEVAVLSHRILTNVAVLANADRCSLFLVKGSGAKRCLVAKLFDVVEGSTVEETQNQKEIRIPWGKGIIGYVAESGQGLIIADAYKDPRFNKDVDIATGYRTKGIMCEPVKNTEGEVIGVAQAINKVATEQSKEDAFTDEDQALFKTYLTFCGISLTNALLFEKSMFYLRKNEVLLEMARGIFEEQSCLKTMVHNILVEGLQLIPCEKCSVMLLGENAGEKTFNRIFQLTHEEMEQGEHGTQHDDPAEVAGSYQEKAEMVARTGKAINVSEFDKISQHSLVVERDQMLKYPNFLCIPIYNKDKRVTGVMQFFNKIGSHYFDEKDEHVFEAFAVFCGLGIHNVMMYDRVCETKTRRDIALEILSYHASSRVDEAVKFAESFLPDAVDFPNDLSLFPFDDLTLSNDETILASARMFVDLHLLELFHIHRVVLFRWLLTVQKNYRQVTYHNWRHAFNVAQCMFAIFKDGNYDRKMTPLEQLTLLVACFCHDLDHRGTNNSFQVKSSSPIAQLYSTSTMEHHHFDHSIMILSSEGNNIFEGLESGQYTQAMDMLKADILATDLALYFRKRGAFQSLVNTKGFDWDNECHRDLMRAMMMTACDLSAITKPWTVQKRVAEKVASEFFEQGDLEKTHLNQQPIPTMDRQRKGELPKMQVGFINNICMPLYETFALHTPSLQPMYEGVQQNRECWQKLADGKAEAAAAAATGTSMTLRALRKRTTPRGN
eukprot:m.157085 g.157085  ORF g.157085 m.157085 type:complete len:773 (+) comp38701_c0_seq3:67-2385(+)